MKKIDSFRVVYGMWLEREIIRVQEQRLGTIDKIINESPVEAPVSVEIGKGCAFGSTVNTTLHRRLFRLVSHRNHHSS